ncbi:MAG: MATE family efflux transporter [Oscillospiraceae bacterium]|nr:MATE family efflux transporter [Oscillospiraceae bacterium]
MTRDRSFYKTLLRLAIPISLQNLVTFAVNFADNLMVGRLGDNAVSGVYMGNQPHTLIVMYIGGTTGALLILAAQYWGKDDRNSIKKVVSIGTMFTLAPSAVLTTVCLIFSSQIISLFTNDAGVIAEGAAYLRIVACSYMPFAISQVLISAMRGVETAKIGMYISFATLSVNVSLNYILIFGKLGFPVMGIRGAAIATVISRLVELSLAILYIFFVDKKLKLTIKDFFQFDRLLLSDFIRYGLPIVGGNIVWSVNMLVSSAILGRFDSEAITAASVAGMLSSLIFIWMNGLSSAVGVITGKTVGAGQYEKMKEYAKTVQLIFAFVGLFSGSIIFMLRDPFISLYSISALARSYAAQFINILAITTVGTCYQATCLFGLVKSGGDVSFVFKNDTIFVFGVVLPLAIIATVSGMPPWIVFACLKCDQLLKCFVAVVKINRFNWMKNLTRTADI